MKKYISLLLLILLPILVMAQAIGGQITRPTKKQQNAQHSDSPNSNTSVKKDTYIRVDGLSSTTINKTSSGGEEVFNITTDAKSWSTWGIPSWCSIENKTSSSFKLRVNKNTTTSERSDYMEVRTPKGHSARINIKQGAAGPSAQIENVRVLHNQTVSGEEGMTIKMKLNVHGLKDKEGNVAVYFYGDNGETLKDRNNKYCTNDGDVATHGNIKPPYENSEWSEFKLSIPYRELHLIGGAGTKSIKFKFVVWDNSVSTSKAILSTSLYSTSFNFDPAFLTVDGTTSDKTKKFSESGGRNIYNVNTSDGSYEIWGVPSWCSIENKTSSSFTLVCNRNTSSTSRSDYMKIKAAGKEIRIDITQDASSGPSAKITSITQEHNVHSGGRTGMNINLKFETIGMKDKKVDVTAWFYYSDNTTKLNNGYGGQVNVSKSDTAPYENTTFTMTLFMPYLSLNMGIGWSGSLSFDIVIKDSSGNLLTRKNNNRFTYSRE